MNLIVLGSITEDIIKTPDGKEQRHIGGVPIYAAATAKALGEKIGIVSKVGTDFHMKNLKAINSLDADLNGFSITGQTSMRFENKYKASGKRIQKVLSFSEKITFKDIPEIFYSIPCIHLGPVFNEIDPQLIDEVRDVFKIVSLDGQGFTRSTEKDNGAIVLKPWLDYKEYFSKLDVLKVDDIELKGITGTTRLKEAIDLALATNLKTLVITRAHKGAIIYHLKKRYDIPTIPTNVVDATGAGDAFIIAYLLEHIITNDCYYSGLIAAAAASFTISFSGPEPQYTRDDIISKLKQTQTNFQLK